MTTLADLSFLGNLPGQIIGNANASGNHGIVSDQAGSYSSNTDPQLLARLAALRQYDPNASITQLPGNDAGPSFYGISYNQDALPAVPQSPDGQRWALHPSDFAANFQRQYATGQGTDAIRNQVIDPSKNINDPVYGDLTPGSNVVSSHVPTKLGLLDILGPMAPLLAAGAFPSLFSGLTGAGAGAGGALGASAAADVGGTSALGNAATKFAFGVPNQLNSGKFNPMTLSGLGMTGLGFPPWLAQIINAARNKSPVGATLGTLNGLGGGP